MQDYTAISVVRGHIPQEDRKLHFDVQMLERPKLGTKYPDIIARVKNIMDNTKIAFGQSAPPTLVVDVGGVGRGPFDEMSRWPGKKMVAISITGGDSVSKVPGGYHVPKRDLVMTLLSATQGEKVHAARGPLFDILREEMLNLKVKINPKTSHDSYEAREGEHDDLVLSVAMAVWYGTEKWRKLEART
jgi:hypothetical protein